MTTNLSKLGQAAVNYAEHGYAVLPLDEGSKFPHTGPPRTCPRTGEIKNYPHKFSWYEASSDVEQVTKWWSEWPEANIGLAAAPNGFLILDVDRHGGADGIKQLKQLMDDNEYFFDTSKHAHQKTPGGGYHLLTRVPLEVAEDYDQINLDSAINTRTKGYIAVAPSIHPNGQEYQWGTELIDGDVPECPDWLGSLMASNKEAGKVSISFSLDDQVLRPDALTESEVDWLLADRFTQIANRVDGRHQYIYGQAAWFGSLFRLGYLAAVHVERVGDMLNDAAKVCYGFSSGSESRSKGDYGSFKATRAHTSIENGLRDGIGKPSNHDADRRPFIDWKNTDATPPNSVPITKANGAKSAETVEEWPQEEELSGSYSPIGLDAGELQQAQDSAQLIDDIAAYLAEVAPTAPDSYHYLGAMHLLSALVAGRLIGDTGIRKTETLTYILLAGSSGRSKSGVQDAINEIIESLTLDWLLRLPSNMTPQMMVSLMTPKIPEDKLGDLFVEDQAQARANFANTRYWHFDEFGDLLDATKRQGARAEFSRGLRTLYNGKHLDSATQSRGVEKVDNPYIALLGTSTFVDMRKDLREGATNLDNGLIARLMIAAHHPEQDRPFIPWFARTTSPDISQLREPLMNIWRILRPYTAKGDIETTADDDGNTTYKFTPGERSHRSAILDKAAADRLNAYRLELHKLQSSQSYLDACYARFDEFAYKFAMLAALCDDDGKKAATIVRVGHVLKAIVLTEICRQGLHWCYDAANNAYVEQSIDRVLEERLLHLLRQAHPKPVSLDRMRNRIKSNSKGEMRKILDALVTSGDVLLEIKQWRGETRYYYTLKQGEK